MVVASEILHHMKCKRTGKMGEVALKLDISKAYDRVDWGFSRGVLLKMGFDHQWVSWIAMCVETVSYTVLMNNEPMGPIIPRRDLRQGDPLSLYLFILCAEGLTALLKRAEARGDIHGIKVSRGAPTISHLLFADDCFLFFRATSRECEMIRDALNVYKAASGQAINLSKSEVYFSSNVSRENRDMV